MTGLKRLLASCVLTLSLSASSAFAHQFHVAYTDVSFNERTGSVEVVHTLHTDDVDALLANLYQRQFDLTQPEDEAVLRKYIEKQFWVAGADSKRLPLHWVGLTVGPETVVVYQEIAGTPLNKAALIHHAILSDFLADQTNTLNLTENGAVRTLSFTRQTQELPLRQP